LVLKFKAFVIDIDGTLLDYDGVLNLEAVNSIRWLRKSGYEVILASGRGPWDTFYLGVFIGCTKLAVCENGGVLMTSPASLKLFTDKSKSLEAYDVLCRKIDDVKVKPVSARLTEVVLLRTFDPATGQAILEEAKLPVQILDSNFALHLTRKGITKARALREGLDLLGIDPEEAVAIGDSETDVSLFELCGYSIAVGNSSEYVKSRANYSTREVMGDGVVEGIQTVAEKMTAGR
jgi:phosphoglycolate phosphatase